jgi:hypothetical protein
MEKAQHGIKVMEFLHDNGIRTIKNDPTNIF